MTAPPARPTRVITHRRVLAIALPVVLSNATVPLQGAIDTAIIGNRGSTPELAAVVLGATALALIMTSFNFLQMGASGLTAEALGAGDRQRVVDTLLRALLVALAIALVLMLFRHPIAGAALALFAGSAEAEALAGGYIRIRLLAAPADLAGYALIGWFTGQELTRRLLEMQLAVSAVNIALSLLFVIGFDWGVAGLAAATSIAVWCGLGVGLWRLRGRLRALAPGGVRPDWRRVTEPRALARVLALNRDIFLRTLCLTGGFAWFARLGSAQGDTVLAANGVLMQVLYISAHALDGFAMAAEALVGQALGARDLAGLRRAALVSGRAALGLAAALAAGFTLLATPMIALFTGLAEVRAAAAEHALWASLVPLAGVLAYQMDGIFIGAAEGRRMRDAMLVAVAVFVPAGWLLSEAFANHGLWAALWLWLLLRAGLLMAAYPAIETRIAARRGTLSGIDA